jgi:hypothetical protein
METTIYQRTRDRKNNPNGVVVATKYRGGVRFGWSKTNTKAGDKFDLAKGREIALERAFNNDVTPVPHSIANDYTDMVNRSVRYFFKGQSVKVVPVKNT